MAYAVFRLPIGWSAKNVHLSMSCTTPHTAGCAVAHTSREPGYWKTRLEGT